MSNTIVEYFYQEDERAGHRCGYCKGKDGNFSQGMWAHGMAVQDYEDLISRGWRRSGNYCYKPDMKKTCCPHYTIRCLVNDFRISKSQKNTLKKANKYFNNDTKDNSDNSDNNIVTSSSSLSMSMSKTQEKSKAESSSQSEQHKKKYPQLGQGPDPDKPKCKKAKQLRKEKALNKNPDKILNKINEEKSLKDFLSELKSDGAHKLEIKLVRSRPRSEEFNRTFKAEFDVYKKYQTVIHNDKPSEISEKQFCRFLVESPLEEEHLDGGIESGYGSFHQQYWIDGRLWMVGVIDVLPSAVSSVYLFHDPDFLFLSPGTYSALREIEFVQQLSTIEPKLKTYMMGYYIHSCVKMRYKGQYDPSFLVCPEAASWHPIKECEPKLDAAKYSRFAPPGETDQELDINLDEVLVLYEKIPTAMQYAVYKMAKLSKGNHKDDSEEVKEYARLVGKTCAKRMLLYRH